MLHVQGENLVLVVSPNSLSFAGASALDQIQGFFHCFAELFYMSSMSLAETVPEEWVVMRQ